MSQIVGASFYQVSNLQNYVKSGKIRDGTNIYEFLMNQPGLLPRFNKLVLPTAENPLNFVSLATPGVVSETLASIKYFVNPNSTTNLQKF